MWDTAVVAQACAAHQRAAMRHGGTEAELLWLFFARCCAPQVRSLNYMRTKVKEPSEDCIYRWGGNILSDFLMTIGSGMASVV